MSYCSEPNISQGAIVRDINHKYIVVGVRI